MELNPIAVRYKSLSSFAIIIVVAWIATNNFVNQKWKDKDSVIVWDAISYYAYLPATFIHKDLSLKFMDKDMNKYSQQFWPLTNEKGQKVIKMSMGLSILWIPFFLLGHLFANMLGFETDGFSVPYKFFLVFSALFYLTVGLIYLRKFLLPLFSEKITALLLMGMALGTNLFNYATDTDTTMSHVYSFSLFAAFIFYTIKWYQQPNLKNSIIVGSSLGIISLIRPTNLLIVTIFLLYDIKQFRDIQSRIALFLKHYYLIILIVFFTFLVWLPQLLYWKHVTGNFLYYSYGSDERFFFNNPQIFNVLFSFRKGLFVYTPVMFFAFIGILFLRKHLATFFIPILTFVLLNTYVISSWWCWWYGGGLGLRAFIESYAILTISLGVFLTWVFKHKNILVRYWGAVLCILLFMYGHLQNIKYDYKSIHYDSMTKEAFWNSFFSITPNSGYWELLKEPDYEAAQKGIYITKQQKHD